jgi:crotonobetainyl-CoA:carnitine CoA-transferase CaiB-like acyl-CoA transferase
MSRVTQPSTEKPFRAALFSTYRDAFGAPPSGPLKGTVVLNFGQAAVGPVAASYLAMLGAVVIKVEKPTGDHVRHVSPTMGGTSHTFIGNNLGQLGVTLDLRNPADQQVALALIAEADVLIENFRGAEVMASYQLDYEHVYQANPRIIYIQASGFGESGPFRGTRSNEWVAQAMAGFAVASGPEGTPEFSQNTSHLDWCAAMVNAVAVLGALTERDATGRGCVVRTSHFGSALFAGAAHWYRPSGANGAIPGRPGLSGIVAGADGRWVAYSAETDEQLAQLPGLHAAEADSGTLLDELRKLGVPAVSFSAADRIIDRLRKSVQRELSEFLHPVTTPSGPILSAAPQWRFSETPVKIPGPAPRLGQHNEAIRAAADGASRPAATPAAIESADFKPLHGVSALLVGSDPATELCALILSSLGARLTVAAGRDGAPAARPDDAYAVALTESGPVVADLTALTDAALAGLCAANDLIVIAADQQPDAWRATLDRAMRAAPGSVFCRVSGWGAGSSLAEAYGAATELTVQCVTGMNRFVGDPAGTRALGFPLVTVATALSAAQGALAGLRWRGRSGQGQAVDVSMLGAAVAMSQWNIVAETGEPDESVGRQLEAYDWPADHGYRHSAGWCLIDFRDNEAGWLQFFAELGHDELIGDPRFNEINTLQRHRPYIAPLLADVLGAMPYADLQRLVRDELHGTIVPVLTPEQGARHPQAAGLGVVAGPAGDPLTAIGFPVVAGRYRGEP